MTKEKLIDIVNQAAPGGSEPEMQVKMVTGMTLEQMNMSPDDYIQSVRDQGAIFNRILELVDAEGE